MSVDPKISMWLNIVIAVLAGIAGGTISLSNVMPPDTARVVVGYATFMTSLFGIINAVLHGTSAPNAGPLVGQPAVKTMVALALSSMVMWAAWGPTRARAQVSPAAITVDNHQEVQHPQQSVLQFEHDNMTNKFPKGLFPAPAPKKPVAGTLDKLSMNDIVDRLRGVPVSDLEHASKIAKLKYNRVAAQCWDAWIQFIKDSDAAEAEAQDSEPEPTMDYRVISKFQTVLDYNDALSPGGPLTIACAPMAYITHQTVPALLLKVAAGSMRIPAPR